MNAHEFSRLSPTEQLYRVFYGQLRAFGYATLGEPSDLANLSELRKTALIGYWDV